MQETKKITVKKDLDGEKIDRAIMAFDLGLSRREVRRLLDRQLIWLDGKRVNFASKRVSEGSQITVPVLSAEKKSHNKVDKDFVVYDKNDLVVVNKPAGIPSQKVRSKKTSHMEEVVESFFKKKTGNQQSEFILCHRLDKETSGALVFARSPQKAMWFMENLKKRTVEKTYYAICFGLPKKMRWSTTCYLSRSTQKKQTIKVVHSGGQLSQTSFEVVSVNKKRDVCLIKAKPKTGRTHQIRVHLAHEGLAIIGDSRYGNKDLKSYQDVLDLVTKRHFLHAHKISLEKKDENPHFSTTAPMTKDFEELLKRLSLEIPSSSI